MTEAMIETGGGLARRAWLRSLDPTLPADREKAKAAFGPEYATLRKIQGALLDPDAGHLGKYVLIHGEEFRVLPSLDDASREGYAAFSKDIFLIIEIDPERFEDNLSA